jgi:hypothetical protein
MVRSLHVLLIAMTAMITPLAAASPDESEFSREWILVRTVKPLALKDPGGMLSTVTGRPALDALIAEAGIHEIDAVFGSTGRAKHPEAAERHGPERTYRFHVPPGTDIEALSALLSALPEVEFAEPDFIVHAQGLAPNDPLYPQQWGLSMMAAEDAWAVAVGEGVVIAVLDSGIDSDHPDMAGKWDPGYDFVNDDADPEDDSAISHGTQVASVISAGTNNSEGMAGVCWDCRLLPVKVLDAQASGTASDFAAGLVWAVDQGARIVNFSSGGASPSSTRLGAINYAYDAGVILVGGVGNAGESGVVYPKARSEFIAVGGTNQLDQRAALYSCGTPGGSNFGPEVDVIAPADLLDVATIDPSVGREEARHLLRSAAVDEVGDPAEDTPGFDVYHGWGRVDMLSTVEAAASAVSLRVEGKTSTRVYLESSNPVASAYDFIRGDLGSLSEGAEGVSLGNVTCLENDSPDADTVGGNEDPDLPAPGEGFFYLSRFSAPPGPGSYGGSSANRDRSVFPSAIASWAHESDQPGARLGAAVRSAGDVNDDGFADIIVGASLYDGDLEDEGAAFVYHGSASGLPSSPSWVEPGGQTSSFFGSAVAGAGDVDGDGYDDAIVGAYLYNENGSNFGRAVVHHGRNAGLHPNPEWTMVGEQAGAWFGLHVDSAGDVNNDGFGDVIVAAPRYTDTQTDEGRVYLYLGSSSTLGTTPAWTAEGGQALAQLGGSLAPAGDINNDGFDDIIVGAPFYDNVVQNEGRVLVYYGSASGLGSTPDVLELGLAGSRFGGDVAGAGDVNNDGFDDVIVGANRFAAGEPAEGAAFVYLGSSSGIGTTPVWSFEGNQAHANLGVAVGGAGDVNNDGYDDVIVGANVHDGTRSDEGWTAVFLGTATGVSASPVWSAQTGKAVAEYGWSVAGGDVNGDGFSDALVGARFFRNGQLSEGAVFVYHGSATGPALPPPTPDCAL